MECTQIRYFLALYEELNFTRAAKRCGVSQPSLTNGIKNLESHVGGKLFYRIASSQSQTRPTELAIALEPHLKRMIDSANLVQETAERFLANQINNERPSGSSLNLPMETW
jgi:DNA-binding transcriptional LysR family regulator